MSEPKKTVPTYAGYTLEGQPGGVTFQVLVTDGQGGHASQSVTVNVCVAPQTWHSDHGMCM